MADKDNIKHDEACEENGGFAPPCDVAYQDANGDDFIAENSEFTRANYGNKRKKRARKPRIWHKALLAVLVIFLTGIGVVGCNCFQLFQSALHVQAEANEAVNDIETIKECLISGNSAKAQQTAQDLSRRAKAISEETDGGLWVLAEKIPVYGEDVATMRTLTYVFEDVCVNAIEPLCDEMAGVSLGSLIGENNTINIDQLTQLISTMSTVAPVLQRSANSFNQCPEPHLGPLKNFIKKASTKLNSANDLFAFATRFAPLIPDFLGVNGSRNYLIVAQNNVEPRCTGGLFGAAGIMSIENGRFKMGDFAPVDKSAADDAYRANELWLDYEPVTVVNFPLENLKDIGVNPDVPQVSQVLHDAYEEAGTHVDGVFLVDPIFVQRLLAYTDEFTSMDGVVIDGSNFATVVMHDAYWLYVNKNKKQNAFFAAVASDGFHHLFSSLDDVPIKDLLETIYDCTQDRHLCIWFADDNEEAAVAELGCDGSVTNDPTEAVTGIYFINSSWTKLEWYLRTTKEVTSVVNNPNGSKTYSIKLTLKNTVPDEDVRAGNWYVTGGYDHCNKASMYQAGDMLERVFLCAPAGGSISEVQTDADIYAHGVIGDADNTIYGLQTYRADIHLMPGATATFTYKVTSSPQATGDLKFDVTPLAETILE